MGKHLNFPHWFLPDLMLRRLPLIRLDLADRRGQQLR